MHERSSIAQPRGSTLSHFQIPCSSAVSKGPFIVRLAGSGWVYAAKLTLEDATGSVDAHLFADDGAEFFQVPQPTHATGLRGALQSTGAQMRPNKMCN